MEVKMLGHSQDIKPFSHEGGRDQLLEPSHGLPGFALMKLELAARTRTQI